MDEWKRYLEWGLLGLDLNKREKIVSRYVDLRVSGLRNVLIQLRTTFIQSKLSLSKSVLETGRTQGKLDVLESDKLERPRTREVDFLPLLT